MCCRQVVAAPDDGNVQRAEAALKLVLSALTACLRSCCRRPRGPTPTGTPGRRTAGTRGRPPCRAGSWPLTSWRRAPVRRLIVHQARRLGPGRAGRPAPRSPPPGARGCAEAAPAPPSDNSSVRSTSRSPPPLPTAPAAREEDEDKGAGTPFTNDLSLLSVETSRPGRARQYGTAPRAARTAPSSTGSGR